MGKRSEHIVAGIVAFVLFGGVAALIYAGWDVILDVVLSPVGGLLAKVVVTGKTLKIAAGVLLAIVAGVVGITNRRRSAGPAATDPAATDPAATDPAALPPPVFGPPVPGEPQVTREPRDA